jgi:branched-chain amino acid transport system permease protein
MSVRGRLDGVRRLLTASDARLLLVASIAIYGLFTLISALLGYEFNGLINALRRLTFLSAVYAMLVLALNLQWGYAGLFNLGVAGFMAIAVYVMGILSTAPTGTPPGLGLPLPVGILGGILAATLLGTLSALPALRLRGDYLAIVTLAFAEIVRRALRSDALREFTLFGLDIGTGGPRGMSLPPSPGKFLLYTKPKEIISEPTALGDFVFSLAETFEVVRSVAVGAVNALLLVLVVALFYLLLVRVGNSPFGRVLKSIREDEVVASALGKDTRWFKIKTFALGCALMGVAGILWRLGAVASTTDFVPMTTFYVFVALIIGGAGSNTGSVLGGAVFVSIILEGPSYVRRLVSNYADIGPQPPTIFDAVGPLAQFDVGPLIAYTLSDVNIAQLRFVLLGVVLIYLIQNRPEGLLGHRKEVASPVDLTDRGGDES